MEGEHELNRWNKKQTTRSPGRDRGGDEDNGVPDDAAKEAGVERVNSQTEAIDARELKAILEAVLFVSPEPMPVARLMSIVGTVSNAEVVQALGLLTHDLDQDGRGIQLVQIAGGYRLVTKQEYGPWLKRMDKAKAAQKLSRSALESLAIIAYKQPLVRAEIEEIRGVETSGVLRTLCERKLVRIVGRKDVPGGRSCMGRPSSSRAFRVTRLEPAPAVA